MTTSWTDHQVFERNLWALLSLGTVVWYCEYCSYSVTNGLYLAGMHLRKEHKAVLKKADEEYVKRHM